MRVCMQCVAVCCSSVLQWQKRSTKSLQSLAEDVHTVCVCALQFVVVVCCAGCGHGVCVWCVVCTSILFTYVA